MNVEFDTPIEVTRYVCNKLKSKFSGVIAHRVDDEGNCWIKIWNMKYKNQVRDIIQTNPK